MLIKNGDVQHQINVLTSFMTDTLDDPLYDSINEAFLSHDLSQRRLNDTACQAEEVMRKHLSENAGFLRPARSFIYLGYTGNAKPGAMFTENKEGRKTKKLKDGTEILWDERPEDTYYEDDLDKSYKGWLINTFIDEVLPWAKSRQLDRILDDDIPFELKPLAIAVINPKGGSHKTTTAVHYAINAVLCGFRVLFVDGDPQATASTLIGYPMSQHPVVHPHSFFNTVSAFKDNEEEFDITDYARPSIYSNLSILTGSTHGSLLDLLVNDDQDLLDRFYDHCKNSGEYDLIVIDTRPQSIYQDFAQYHAADILMNTVPANTIGVSSTNQGLNNFLGYCQKTRNEIFPVHQGNRISIVTMTNVDTHPNDISKSVHHQIESKYYIRSTNPVNMARGYVPKSANISKASSVLQTVFQETNIDVKSQKTNSILDAINNQFEEVFENAILPFYLKFEGVEVDEAHIRKMIGAVDESGYDSDLEFGYKDLGFAWGVVRKNEDDEVLVNAPAGKIKKAINSKRYLTAKDIGLDEGYQIVMKDGVYKALSYDLDKVKPIRPCVLRHNVGG